MAQKLIIIEINEMPLRIFRQFQKLRPGSHVDELLKSSQVIETLAQDVEQSFLYPSQSWASLNTGAPYSAHKIHWYNDPKPGVSSVLEDARESRTFGRHRGLPAHLARGRVREHQ